MRISALILMFSPVSLSTIPVKCWIFSSCSFYVVINTFILSFILLKSFMNFARLELLNESSFLPTYGADYLSLKGVYSGIVGGFFIPCFDEGRFLEIIVIELVDPCLLMRFRG
mmetsp:Transcript_9599/g.13103  ORF Transcript_9599/g.13103 Transcript_9599/m.13103 type:complete len:113 (+) Transcript_9599:1252-1590(+)